MKMIRVMLCLSLLLCGSSCSKRRVNVGSSSMEPTLKKGDMVITDTSAYKNAVPSRWDVIIFEAPPTPQSIFMSRIVGMPGETIEFRSSGLHIDGKLVKPPAELKIISYLPADPSLVIPNVTRPPNPFTIPTGQYFVMGDNVENSLDSRFWGAVPSANIKGRVSSN